MKTFIIRTIPLIGILVFPVIYGQQPSRPRSFALENVRIITVSDSAIERGVIVLENGLIRSVGVSAEIPANAWRIDGQGLTVYPGFVNALSDLELSNPASEENNGNESGRAGEDEELSRGADDRPASTPWAVAADSFSPTDENLRKWRNRGFTTVAVAPRDGIFPGQVSLINLTESPNQERVIEPRAALAIRLPEDEEGYRGYPGALLGRIAYIRQVFLDARHYSQSHQIYDTNPSGLERPRDDRVLEPIAESLQRGRTVLSQREFDAGHSVLENHLVRRLAPAHLEHDCLAAYWVSAAMQDVSRSHPPRQGTVDVDVLGVKHVLHGHHGRDGNRSFVDGVGGNV